MAQEIELKLSLPAAAHRALLRHPLLRGAACLGTRKLVNAYYDTPDLALHRKGIALRTRKAGRLWLQTVKCAGTASGGLAVRPEWEQPYRGRFDFAAIDDAKLRARLQRPRIRNRLAPLFTVTFTRRTWRLAPAPGTSLQIMLDRGRIEAGGRQEALSELEIELEHGDMGALFDLAHSLSATLPLRPEIRSKAERGYSLHLDLPLQPRRAAPSPLLAAHAPPEAFRALAATCIAQLEWNALGAGLPDAEFIHQMRVALRRLRSALRVFRPALPAGFAPAALVPLRPLASALGAARDWDVLAEEILAPACRAFAGNAGMAALGAAVARARQQARDAARQQLGSAAHAAALLDFGARLCRAESPHDGRSLAEFAGRRLHRLHRRLQTLVPAAGDTDPVRLHALRIGVKRLRYAIEFFAPLYPARKAHKAIAALAALQDTLGALNDLARAGALFAQCADGEPDLRDAVALTGGWHGPRHAALCAALPRELARLTALRPFWNNRPHG